jgi:hypothetical protein
LAKSSDKRDSVIGDVVLRQIRMEIGTCYSDNHQNYGPRIECAADYRPDGIST